MTRPPVLMVCIPVARAGAPLPDMAVEVVAERADLTEMVAMAADLPVRRRAVVAEAGPTEEPQELRTPAEPLVLQEERIAPAVVAAVSWAATEVMGAGAVVALIVPVPQEPEEQTRFIHARISALLLAQVVVAAAVQKPREAPLLAGEPEGATELVEEERVPAIPERGPGASGVKGLLSSRLRRIM